VGQTQAYLNIVPEFVNAKTGSVAVSDYIKAIATIYGYALSGMTTGGLQISPHLVKTLNTGTPIDITDDDIIAIKSMTMFSDVNKGVSPLSIATNSELLTEIYTTYYREFISQLDQIYSVDVDASFYKDNLSAFKPFAPFTVDGKTCYLLSWTEPLDDDVVSLELIGGIN
jgi:hypothetical protein